MVHAAPIRLAVLVSGAGTTLANLSAVIARGELAADVRLVVGSRPGLAGLTRAPGAATAVVDRRAYADVDLFSRAVFAEIDRAEVDLVCLAGWLCLLAIPDRCAGRVMNIHPALLPSFGGRGMYGRRVHQAVIDRGCQVSGCTVHLVDNEYDAGPIVLQRTCPVLDGDTADTLAARVFEQECEAYPEAIRLFTGGRLHADGRRVRLRPERSEEPRTEGTPAVSGAGRKPLTSGVPSVRGSFTGTGQAGLTSAADRPRSAGMSDVADQRKEYRAGELLEAEAAADPVDQFRAWFADAEAAAVPEPTAMTLATADADGRPSARVVLLKGYDARGFVFYSNHTSGKGRDLAANPWASLVFFWPALERQVRIDGRVDGVDRAEADAYFHSRPVSSQIGAWTSRQSAVIPSRDVLEQREAELKRRFGDAVPLPEFWGGYRVVPEQVEFWQGRPSRLHDRLRYTRAGDAWVRERLSP